MEGKIKRDFIFVQICMRNKGELYNRPCFVLLVSIQPLVFRETLWNLINDIIKKVKICLIVSRSV